MRRNVMAGMFAVVALGLVAGGCGKKDDEQEEESPAPKATTEQEQPEEPEPTKLSDEELLKKFKACWDLAKEKKAGELADCYAEDAKVVMLDSVPPREETGPGAVEKLFQPMWDAFPDMKYEHAYILQNGNKFATAFVAHGTHEGELMGMEPTGKEVELWAAQVVEMNDQGKVVRDIHVSDTATLMAQLGVMPNPEAPMPADVEPPEETMTIVAEEGDAGEANLEALKASEDAMSKGEWDAVLALYADDAEFYYVGGKKKQQGKEALAKTMKEWTKMHSEMTGETDNAWAAGDWVVAETNTKGTLAVNMPGAPVKTKGKSYEANYVELIQMKDGKITQHWIFPNNVKMMADIGLYDPEKMAGGKEKAGE